MLYSVMLVDNEPAIPRGLIRLIDWESCGCRVTAVAGDGKSAVQQMWESPPDIVITDIRMPEMDGLELCRWIREHCPAIQIILLTGFPDFEYAQQAIQYQVVDFVLKPTTEESLSAAVKKACENLRKREGRNGENQNLLLEQQMLLGEMIFNNRHSLLYTLNRLHELEIDLSGYYVVSLHVLDRDNQEGIYIRQTQELLRECWKDQLPYFVSKSDNACYAVLNLPEGTAPEALCLQAVELTDQKTDFVLTAGISRRHHNPLHLQMAAREADDAQQFTQYSSQPSVMCCENLPQLSDSTAQVLLEKLRLVEAALENCSREATMKNLDALFDFVRTVQIPFSSLYQMASLLYNFCTSLLLSHNLSSGNLSSEYYGLQGSTAAELEAELRRFVAETLIRIGRTQENIDSIIFKVKLYIDQNYNTSLSLDSLAAQVHLSPSYFSKLFKREMGENLSTYIQNTRIERAKILLRTTDKKAYEIAEEVGIYDPVYFSKIFKKATGLKPREYRKKPAKNRKEERL